MKKVKQILKRLLIIINKPEMKILPGHLGFFLVLSVIPIITLVGYIASLFSISVDSLIELMNNSMPQEVGKILIPYISGQGIDVNIVFFMIVGFFLASNGAASIIVASNTLYNLQQSSYLKMRIKALFMTVLLLMLFVFILLFLTFGNHILNYILSLDMIKGFTNSLYFLIVLIRWPISMFLIFVILKIIYTIAPDSKISAKYVNKGAIFTTICWTIVTAIYSFYVNNFSNYDIFYGSLSNIIVLMMWVYILSYILVIGMAINTSSYHIEKTDEEK